MSSGEAPAVPAATLMIARDGAGGLEVLMVRRTRKMAFAGGALVFPGGKVEPRDEEGAVQACCEAGHGLEARELALRIAGVREAFEEAGVLVAIATDTGAPADLARLGNIETLRQAVSGGHRGLEEVLTSLGARLAPGRLQRFAHWITPRHLKRRYDTHFYLAAAEAGQIARHDGSESDEAVWVKPAEVLELGEAGEVSLMFPTRMNLSMLARSATLDEAMISARARVPVTVEPWPEERQGKMVLCIPEEAGYGVTEEPLERILEAVRPPGSR